MTKVKPTKEQLQEAYNRLKSLRKVGQEFGYTGEGIRCLMHQIHIKASIPNKDMYNRDELFFSRDTEESFYIAGYYAADGCVMLKRNKGEPCILAMSLGIKDKDHLDLMRQKMQATNPIYYKLVKNEKFEIKNSEQFELRFTSRRMCQDLKRFNIVPRKTHIYTFPEWLTTHPLVKHFMRGTVDGDGSLGYYNDNYKFNIVGTKEFVISFREILNKNCNLDFDSGNISEKPGCWSLTYGGNLIVGKICEFLYGGATIALGRKKSIALAAIKYLEQHRIEQTEYQERKAVEAFRKASHRWLTRPPFAATEENVAKLYETNTVRGVAKNIGKRFSTARELLEFAGVEVKSSQLNLDKERLEKLYLKHKSFVAMAEELGCHQSTVVKYMEQYGLNHISNRWKREHQHDFFSQEKESPEQFFWAGYLLGNSSIVSETSTLRVTSKDILDIEKFRDSEIPDPEAMINQTNGSWYLLLVSKRILQDLEERFGIDQNKNYHYRMPKWLTTHKYFGEFLRGRFNPDGSFAKKSQIELNGPGEFLEQIREIFMKKLSMTNFPEVRKRPDKESYRFTLTGSTKEKINQLLESYHG